MQITFLTGSTNDQADELAAFEPALGLLVQPDTAQYRTRLENFGVWGADNACFAKGDTFDVDAWLDFLASFTPGQRARCLFATAPDVVGDAAATLERSLPHLATLRQLGYQAAFVAQDGCEAPGMIPWDQLDVLFLGGSTEWKLSEHAEDLTREAHRRGKRVHMGRVNSRKRLLIALSWGVDTADGTYLAFGPRKNLPRLRRWLNELFDMHHGEHDGNGYNNDMDLDPYNVAAWEAARAEAEAPVSIEVAA